jgi:mannosyltransferase OCH1-like enzyme
VDTSDDESLGHPISEAIMGNFTSTDTRTFGTRRNAVVSAFLLSTVLYSLVSSTFYSGLTYGPDSASQENQINEIIMAASRTQPNIEIIAMKETKNTETVAKQPNTEFIAKETTPQRRSLVDSLAELNSLSPMECPKGFVRINDVHIPENINDPTRKIPKIVFQTSRSRCITPRLYELTTRWRFEGWSYYFYDDDAIMRVLHEEFEDFPHLKLLTQRCIDYGTIKADIWRYIVLWKYGGLYADLDSVPTNFTGDTIQPEDDSLFVVESYHLLSQYFMSSSAKHPLMYYTIQRSLLKLLDAEDTGQFNAALKTGPHALHAGYMQFMQDVDVLIQLPRTKPIKAGLFVGTNNRSVTVIGLGGKQSNEFVMREEIKLGEKLNNYKKMNMTHNQEDKKHPSGHSCFSALYQGFVNNEKEKEITQ